MFGQTTYLSRNICPVGSFCPAASRTPTPCTPGTYNPNTGKKTNAECIDCTPGFYCASYNLTAPSGPCDPGFVCTIGSSVPSPFSLQIDVFTNRLGGGSVCPVASYCPRGTAAAYACPAGTYNGATQQAQCTICPASFFCPSSITNYGSNHCPAGYFCPNGTESSTQHPCPPGTYSNKTMLTSVNECKNAPPGYYSSGVASLMPSGKCNTGFYCYSGASSSSPFCNDKFCTTGGQCIHGQECVEGSSLPIPCRAGYYCDDNSGIVTGLCAAGYYCVEVCIIQITIFNFFFIYLRLYYYCVLLGLAFSKTIAYLQ